MRRTIPLVILLAALTGVGLCFRAETARPVIGFAYTHLSSRYLELADLALRDAGWAHPLPRFLYDSTAEAQTSEGALTLAARFVGDPEVAVVVGPSNSRHALATAPAYNAAGLAHIVPSATSRRLRSAGPATFVLVPDDSVQGEFIARFAREQLGARRAMVFYVNDEYGEGLRQGIESNFVAQGGIILGAFPVGGEIDISVLLRAAFKRGRPDVVLMAGRSDETGQLLRALHTLDRRIPVVAGDGAYLPAELLRASGGDLDSLYVVAFWVYDSTNAAHRAFADRVRAVFHADPMPEDALTEDALVLATEARTAAGADRAAVRRWLAGLGRDRPAFQGLTGRISFGPDRELPLAMVRFQEGRAIRADHSLVGSAPAP
jgi:branched-chain amino acid transport system substrate-binding protein